MHLYTQFVSWLALAKMTSPSVVHELALTTANENSYFQQSIKSDDDPTSFTPVGNSADSPAPLLRPSPATDHDAEKLDI
jgi:hypothetical protein